MSQKFVETWHQGKKQNKTEQKNVKKTRFFSVFFHFCLDRSKCNPWRNLYFFNCWSTCCKKKTWFFTLFLAFFSFPTSFYKTKNAWQIQKKCVFWHFALHYSTQQKKFFSTFVLRKHSQFLSHIINNYFFLFFYAHPMANI